MGTKLKFSTTFHPQTDGQSERTIQILEDMLRTCALDFKGAWDEKLSLIEFAYNNSYQATIQMAPYEALYGKNYCTPLLWNEVGERRIIGPEFVEETCRVIDQIKERVSPVRGLKRFGKKGKLCPRYVGPYEILTRRGNVAYQLALPPSMSSVHNVFHVSLLKKYVRDPSHILTANPLDLTEDLTFEVVPVMLSSQKVQQLRTKAIHYVKRREGGWKGEGARKKKEVPPLPFDDAHVTLVDGLCESTFGSCDVEQANKRASVFCLNMLGTGGASGEGRGTVVSDVDAGLAMVMWHCGLRGQRWLVYDALTLSLCRRELCWDRVYLRYISILVG
ncbi:hypothetical protein NE237_005595 [Protea cynaroides]|uniref:Integrase catalytic domain-containing protein n=1 Tax=Protea cynaroides TaxID=273540 RepID=A0A9Q0GKT0_9MAGN|nr:hypothetical protein NE237_005595 [Protea cynaroides]